MNAFKAARMKEREVLQRSNAIHLIDNFVASQTCRFVEIWSVHDRWWIYGIGTLV